jgi:hypothetical protein
MIRMFIPNPDFDFLPIPDPGSSGQKGTGSWIRIRSTDPNPNKKVPIRILNTPVSIFCTFLSPNSVFLIDMYFFFCFQTRDDKG